MQPTNLQILNDMWQEALENAAKNIIQQYIGGNIAINTYYFNKRIENRCLSFNPHNSRAYWGDYSRTTQLRRLKQLHQTGIIRPFSSDYYSALNFFSVSVADEILNVTRVYWQNQGIASGETVNGKSQTSPKPENFDQLMNDLTAQLKERYLLPNEIKQKAE